MTAQAALRAALRDVLGPNARGQGFKGSAPTWRKQSAAGDWAVVNVQSSSSSSADRLRCFINLAVAPEPWLRWSQENLGSGMPKTVTENLGLYRDRLHPAGTPGGSDGWWEVTGEASAMNAVRDMTVQLDAHGWPILNRLLEPGAMLSQIRPGSLGHMKRQNLGVFFARAEAIALMDRGPSEELAVALKFALDNCVPWQRENAARFDAWVRAQAENSH